jgi:hypothetical protein
MAMLKVIQIQNRSIDHSSCLSHQAIKLIDPSRSINNGRSLFAKYAEKPDHLPIRYFQLLNSTVHRQVRFSDVHGVEIELYCEYKVALRKRMSNLIRPYLFVNFPMAPGDELYIRILSVDTNYRST